MHAKDNAMNTTTTPITTASASATYDPRPWTATVSWGAIFAGLVLAMMVYLVLSVLGTAIGASTIDPLQEANPFSGFGLGTGIWAGVTTLIAMAAGGYLAGYLARRSGALHGLMAWALTTLITLYFIFSVTGSVLGLAGSAARAGLSAAGSAAGAGVAAAGPDAARAVKDKAAEAGLDVGTLQAELGKLLGQGTGAQGSQNSESDIKAWFDRIRERGGDGTLTTADREALVKLVADRTGKPRAEAEQIAANYEKTYQDARQKYDQTKAQAAQKAREAGDKTAQAVSRGSWATLAVLLIGAVVASLAGGMGFRSQKPDIVTTYGNTTGTHGSGSTGTATAR
jgi:ElaB/YqjD/DUF883 family membrane-anchored ribosome-binding protein